MALFGSALLALFLPDLLHTVKLEDKLNTLYAVAGIMFSVGMSLIITTSFPKVKNDQYKNRIQSNYDSIRNIYIFEFLIVTVLYMFIDSKQEPLQLMIKDYVVKFSLPLFLGWSLVFSIIFFIINFIDLQNLNRKINDWLEEN